MNTNAHLAYLLQVQAGLLDAYLEQNLGTRYACCILVCEVDAPRRVRAVTNWTHPEACREVVRELSRSADIQSAQPIAVDRSPRFLEVEAS